MEMDRARIFLNCLQSGRQKTVSPVRDVARERRRRSLRGVCEKREEENYEESLKKGVVEGAEGTLITGCSRTDRRILIYGPRQALVWRTHHLFYPLGPRDTERTHFTFGHLFLLFSPLENRS